MRLTGLLVLIVIATTTLIAQTFRGGIVGTVAEAHVTVVSGETGLVRSTETDSEGNYTFTELPLGVYEVSVVKPSFRTQTVKDIHVSVSLNQRANFELSPGDVEQKVEVSAAEPLIET